MRGAFSDPGKMAGRWTALILIGKYSELWREEILALQKDCAGIEKEGRL